jgi:hypothetical protein
LTQVFGGVEAAGQGTLLRLGDKSAARQAWEQGITAAQAHGDKQAEKEMTVFLKKLDRQA